MGKNTTKELSHFAIQQKVAQQCKLTILHFLKSWEINKNKQGHVSQWQIYEKMEFSLWGASV